MINPLRLKRDAYAEVFRGNSGERVLRDLAKFCGASASTFDPDPRIHAFREGRREVWLRIQKMMNLPDDRVRELSEVIDE